MRSRERAEVIIILVLVARRVIALYISPCFSFAFWRCKLIFILNAAVLLLLLLRRSDVENQFAYTYESHIAADCVRDFTRCDVICARLKRCAVHIL